MRARLPSTQSTPSLWWPVHSSPNSTSLSRWESRFNTYIFVINSLRPSEAIWRQRTGSTLAQVMACCLMAPSHYLNQCWLIISKVLWLSWEGNFTRDASITKVCLKITCLKLHSNFPGANELISWHLVSPGHQQLWYEYGQYRINYSMIENFTSVMFSFTN